MTSCRTSSNTTTTTATSRNEAHTEATLSLKHTIDSVIVRETVVIRERPDTVTVERERTVWRERIVHDTVREHTTDTIIKTVTVEKVVEAAPAKRGRESGWALLLLVAVLVLVGACIAIAKRK